MSVDRQAVVAGGRRAGEDALADAVDDRLLQGVAAEGEHEQADTPGRPSGVSSGGERALEPGLGVAADDGGGVARSRPRRRVSAQPVGLGGDDQPGRRHRERFGERVLDLGPIDGEHGGPVVGGIAMA